MPCIRRKLRPKAPSVSESSSSDPTTPESLSSPNSNSSCDLSLLKNSNSDLSQIVINSVMEKLPPEIVHLIMVHVLCDNEYTTSVFSERFCPTWNGWQNSAARRAVVESDYMRAEIYTAGRGGRRGTYTTSTGPINIKGHIPTLANSNLLGRTDVRQKLRRAGPQIYEDAKRELHRKQIFIFVPERFQFPYSKFSVGEEWERRINEQLKTRSYVIGPMAPTILPFSWPDPNLTILSKQVFDEHSYARIRHLMLCSTKIYKGAWTVSPFDKSSEEMWRLLIRPEYALAVDQRIMTEQAAWLYLDWERLRGLETLHINLDCIEQLADKLPDTDDLVRTAAARMCRHLRLERLVIYGLKSGKRYIGIRNTSGLYNSEGICHVPFNFSIEDIEHSPDLQHLGQTFPNWIRLFRGALRPDGQLILLNEREDEEFDWEMVEELGLREHPSDKDDAPLWMDYFPEGGEEFELSNGGYRNLTAHKRKAGRRWGKNFTRRSAYKAFSPRMRQALLFTEVLKK